MKINNKNIFILMNTELYLAIAADDTYIISTDTHMDKKYHIVLSSYGKSKYVKMIKKIAEAIDNDEITTIELYNLVNRVYGGKPEFVVPFVYNELYDDIESVNEGRLMKLNKNDKALLESLITKYGKHSITNALRSLH
jgi:hypothetical protein